MDVKSTKYLRAKSILSLCIGSLAVSVMTTSIYYWSNGNQIENSVAFTTQTDTYDLGYKVKDHHLDSANLEQTGVNDARGDNAGVGAISGADSGQDDTEKVEIQRVQHKLASDKIAGFHEKLRAGVRGGRGMGDTDTVNLFVPRGETLDVHPPTGLSSVAIDNVCTQDVRRAALDSVCKRYRGEIDNEVDFNNSALYSNFIVDDKHEVLYCSIAKVSCTVWKDLLALRSGAFTLEELLTPQADGRIPAFMLHRKGFFKQRTKLYHLSQLPIEEIQKKLEKYKKMMIVRNPFSRLYSGYSDKMVIENKGFSFAKHIRALYKDLPLTNDGYLITFKQFLNMLVQGNLPEYSETKLRGFAKNSHWRSMASICRPCHVHFDYIAKLETMDTDKYNLFKWFNATDKDLLSTTRPSYTKYTNVFNYTLPHINDIYTTIPDDLMSDIRQLYRYDAELFGYDYDHKTGPVCKTDHSETNCC